MAIQNFYKKGISILEVLVAIAVIGVLASIVVPQFSKMKQNQALKNATEDTISALHTAQTQSLASINSGEFGVHFQSGQIIIFSGETFSAGAQGNTVINVVSPANISNVTLGGVSSASGDLYFGRLSGLPSKTGTVTISIPSNSKTITISATGAISFN